MKTNKLRNAKRVRERGFTLIELMITVAIVGILAAIAYPSYRNQVMKSNRTIARNALLTYAQSLEKCFTQYGSYTDANCGIVKNPIIDTSTFDSGKAYYAIKINTPTASSYTITATAQGPQANDASCATFSLDNTGAKSATGTASASCW